MTSLRQRIIRNEAGMTLTELTVAFLVMAIIIGPLSASVIIGLKSTEQSIQRTTDTSDQQLLASYFTPDVQSAMSVQTTSTCGATVGTPFLELRWTDPVDPVASREKVATYVVTSANQVHRVFCVGDATTQTQGIDMLIVNTVAATPTVTCDGVACAAGASTPREVAVHVETKGTNGPDPVYDEYAFDLSATRRVT